MSSTDPAIYDLDIYQRAAWSLDVTWTDSTTDFTSYSARANYVHADGSTVVQAMTISNDVKGAGSYALTASLTPAITTALTTFAGRWYLELYTAADADVRRIAMGSVTVHK